MKKALLKNVARIMAAVMTLSILPVSSPVTVLASTTINVGKGNGYDFNTVTAAVQSISTTPTENNPVNIYIDKGVYEESFTIDKPYVNLVGKGKAEDVVITYDKASGHEDKAKNLGTEKSATVMVASTANGFSAKNITFENSYNITDTTRTQTQAVAFESMADKVVLDSCRFVGRQDTLYLKGASKGQNVYGSANNARVYVNNCYVEGTVDYIFGDATAYFNDCKLFMAYNSNGGHFTAPNTTLFNIGFVFNNCNLSVDKQYTDTMKSKIDLGRPWQCDSGYPNFGSQSVFINCTIPTLLNDEGFSLWDSTTIEGKTRFMEYGSRLTDGSKADLSKRADFVKALTKEQAEVYSVYNVLSGTDGWNPAKAQISKLKASDVTLDSYEINLPLGESTELKSIVLPVGASSSVSYKASNDCVSVEGNKITALKTGTARVYAQLENGISTYATVTVASARTQLPQINAIKIASKDKITTGDKLTASYSFALDSDNKADKSLIRWYSVKDGKTTLLKSGVGDYYKTYTVQNADAGSYIMLGVRPATATTYGEYGEETTVTTSTAVVKAEDGTENYLTTGFTDSLSGFKVTDGDWKVVTDDGNGFAVPATDKAAMECTGSDSWDDATYSLKLRVNPNATGLGSEDRLSLYFNSNADSCYRLDVTRGSNTKSLKLNLYKVENGKETALYTDEDKLKGIVLTNSGEDNTNVYITFAKSNDKINLICTLEGADTKLIGKTIIDSNPFAGGSFKLDFDGKAEIWQLDNITVDAAKQIDKESQIRVYLAGDSTVKDYGDDNSIGGWGEYIKYYFDDGVEIINKAEGGRSTRSYLNQGRLDEITSQLREGDYVFIQFGHNDNRTTEDARVEHSVLLGEPDENGIYPTVKAEKTKTPQRIVDFYKNDAYPYGEYFYPYESGTFKWYLKQYIEQVRAKGATPVIITPVCRVLFDADGKIQPAFGENNGYKVAAEQAAAECGVACIDAYSITQQLYEGYGVLTTQGLHDVKDDGTMDLTHYNKFGANIVASKLAAAVGETIPELQSHIIVSKTSVSKTDDMKTANLFVVGDSGKGKTDSDVFAAHGFTEYMQDYFNDKITVRDYTIAGATAKSFSSTKAYNDFINSVNEGDYVMISFGRYDSEAMAGGYTCSGEDKENANSFAHYIYYYYVKPVADKKAIPVLLTPINNRAYGTDGTAVDTSGEYDSDLLTLVTDNSLSFVNVSNITYELYKNMGEEGSKVLNALDSKNGYDNKALSEFGAQTVAKQVVNSMKYSSATLKNYILDSKLNEKDILTRGEFVTVLADIAGFEDVKSSSAFNDVVSGKPYEKAVAAAASLGIAKGDENGCFYPEAVLDGETMVEMLEKTMEYKKLNKDSLNDVYALAGDGAVSNEIGLWALDRLCEVINK